MKGLELSHRFFTECGAPIFQSRFPELWPQLAFALCGSGSECYGLDDEISRDHDFEPAFCVLLPSESVVDRTAAFQLERLYSSLPREFLGFRRGAVSPVGGARHGVMRISDFYLRHCGSADGTLTPREWLSVPSDALAEAVNGDVFLDNFGEFSAIRARLACYPEDVRRKKLAGNLLRMAQTGQYNYGRSIARGETASAQLAAVEFVQGALQTLFLLNRRYAPYYKWIFPVARTLERGATLTDALEFLISTDNAADAVRAKRDVIEGVASEILSLLKEEGLPNTTDNELEREAYLINDTICDIEIRSLNIFYGL